MADIEKQISDSILQPTERLLELLGLAWRDEAPLIASMGRQGRRAHGLVVVGRSPGSGTDPFTATEVRESEGRRRVLAQLRRQEQPPAAADGPLGAVAREVARGLGEVDGSDEEWKELVGWTHLCPIGPEGGEASAELRAVEQGLASQIFWREVLIWKPRRLLLMTGLDWAAPFVYANHASELKASAPDQLVQATGALVLQGAKTPAIVVTDPPTEETAERAAEIVEAFRSLGAGPEKQGGGKGLTEITIEPGSPAH